MSDKAISRITYTVSNELNDLTLDDIDWVIDWLESLKYQIEQSTHADPNKG